MIPSGYVWLESLPRINGKVHRAALSRPDRERPDLACPYVAPRNAIERNLSSIWSEILDVDRVGINDDFFELGGHSLAATRLLSRIMKRFHLTFSLEILAQSSTVAEM